MLISFHYHILFVFSGMAVPRGWRVFSNLGLMRGWADEGMLIRLDIRHWLHRWDAVVIKQSHAKYGIFISALAGAILAYNKQDMDLLIRAIKNGNPEKYGNLRDEEMLSFVKPYQAASYVRRVTRGVQASHLETS